jgi:hypothetical protein
MVSTPELVAELRLLLGEPDASDSLFTDDQLSEWLVAEPNMNYAAYHGWLVKAAHFANLVTSIDGSTTRMFSDLLANANEMVDRYRVLATNRSMRARVGRIVRPWRPWMGDVQ